MDMEMVDYTTNGYGTWYLVQSDEIPTREMTTWAIQHGGCLMGDTHGVFDRKAEYLPRFMFRTETERMMFMLRWS